MTITIEEIVGDLKDGRLDPSDAVMLLRTHIYTAAQSGEADWRDIFAALALQAIVAKIPTGEVELDVTEHEESAARGAYGYADAMLRVRSER